MDGTRFDTLTRSLTATGSRRLALRGLLVGALGFVGKESDEAAAHNPLKKCKKKAGKQKKKCLKKAKKHNARHSTDGGTGGGTTNPIDRVECADQEIDCHGACIPDFAQCCGTVGDCAAGDQCIQNQCVTWEGTCPAGADFCVDRASCTGSSSELPCSCFTTVDDETRCGKAGLGNATEGECGSDADCAAQHPDIPGVFCVKDTGDHCSVTHFCRAPCSTPLHITP